MESNQRRLSGPGVCKPRRTSDGISRLRSDCRLMGRPRVPKPCETLKREREDLQYIHVITALKEEWCVRVCACVCLLAKTVPKPDEEDLKSWDPSDSSVKE